MTHRVNRPANAAGTHGAALRLCLDPWRNWTESAVGEIQIWSCTQGCADDQLFALAVSAVRAAPDLKRIRSALADLEGNFAFVASGSGRVLAAVDRVRSIPLLYASEDGEIILGDSGPAFEKLLGLGTGDVDSEAALAVAMSGYTIGNDTIYSRVRQLGPGMFLLASPAGLETATYGDWHPWTASDRSDDELSGALKALNERVIEKLTQSLQGSPVLVPLSAGADSRFVVSGLAEAGYRNVQCVAYGRPGNHEARTSREIARRLGYDWQFVPYSHKSVRSAMSSPGYGDFERCSDSLTGIHFAQEFLLLRSLRDKGHLSEETVVVNGQAGDFISGNHIPDVLTQETDERLGIEERRNRVVDAMIAQHYKLWQSLLQNGAARRIRERLIRETDAIGGMPETGDLDYAIYEHLEFWNRQTKYVLNGQRHYEYFGLDWRLPLWDREYMDFWAAAPLRAKARQSLYRKVLGEQNWGGVWRDIDVNRRNIRPVTMIPVRWAAKALLAPFGRRRWHSFEHRFIEYWTHPVCSYGALPFLTVAFDRRGPANPFAYIAQEYLAGKGLDYGGGPSA